MFQDSTATRHSNKWPLGLPSKLSSNHKRRITFSQLLVATSSQAQLQNKETAAEG